MTVFDEDPPSASPTLTARVNWLEDRLRASGTIPVADLERSKEFFASLGFSFNPLFGDESAACMLVGEQAFVMLLTHDKFAQFTPKRIADAHETSEALICISADSREEVDQITDKALAAGGREPREKQDHGFMYGRSFEDPDGHIWEVMWMDVATATAPQAATADA